MYCTNSRKTVASGGLLVGCKESSLDPRYPGVFPPESVNLPEMLVDIGIPSFLRSTQDNVGKVRMLKRWVFPRDEAFPSSATRMVASAAVILKKVRTARKFLNEHHFSTTVLFSKTAPTRHGSTATTEYGQLWTLLELMTKV